MPSCSRRCAVTIADRPRAGSRRWRPFALAVALLLGGCVLAPAAPGPAFEPLLAPGFDLAGRFSARHGDEGVAGRFSWTHAPANDVLLFSTPTGQALARLSGGGEGGVVLEAADGRTARAADWPALTTDAIGVPLPVEGLAWWIRGVPRPGSAHAEERDAQGRPLVLRQDGWEVVYTWGEGARPVRLALSYPDVEVRLALDRE